MMAAGKNNLALWVLLTIALSLVAFAALGLASRSILIHAFTHRSSYRVAEYEGFEARLAGDGDRVLKVRTQPDRAVSKRIFVKRDNFEPVLLADLPEAWLKELARDGVWRIERRRQEVFYIFGVTARSYFVFEHGRLLWASFGTDKIPLKISATPTGPFVSPPVPIEQFLELFGKPKRYRKEKNTGGV